MDEKDDKPDHWDEFHEMLMQVYWPSLPPEQRLEERPGKISEDEPDVPGDIWRAAYLIYPDVEGWFANPIPAQRSRTPLQLIKRGQGRKVRDILIEIAPHFLPDPASMIPWTPEPDEGEAGAEG